jgi:hypothetical protein
MTMCAGLTSPDGIALDTSWRWVPSCALVALTLGNLPGATYWVRSCVDPRFCLDAT